jgi:light-regulated signal transduction histidine kinase (bacteriophytochrome)
VDCSIQTGLQAKGDKQLLHIVLANLLGNAWKYTSKQPEARIEFGSKKENGETVYFVEDNGAGFNMEFAKKLFVPFQRMHRPDEFPGSGVGLATVSRIINKHGGRIWAESAPGKGATFYFSLD